MDFSYCWDSYKASQMSTWNPKFRSTCINFQNWQNDPCFNCETFVGIKSFDDFEDAKIDFLDQI